MRAKAAGNEIRGETRGRLLGAAAGLFARHGYAAASVRDICDKAGVTQPVLYWHFRNKEGMYLAVLEEVVRSHQEAVASALARGGSAAERIVRVLESAADVAGRNRDTLLMIQSALFGLSRGAPAFDLVSPRRQFRKAVLSLVNEGIATGEIRRGNAADMTDALLGVLDIQMRAIRTGASPRTARGRINRLARVVFVGLLERRG